MAWSTSNSDNLTSSLNSTMTTCIPCLSSFPYNYAAALTSSSLLSLPLKVLALWVSFPITEKTDLLRFNIIISNFLITLTNLLTMSSMLLFSQSSEYMWNFLFSLTAFGHPLFYCLFCMERYLAVEHPTIFLKYRPLRYRLAALAPAWATVLLIYFMSIGVCATQTIPITVFLPLQCTVFVLILVITSFCCVSVLRALIRPPPGDGRRGRNCGGGRQNKQESLNYKIKKKAFINVAWIQVYITTLYLPPVAMIFSHVLHNYFCNVYMYNLSYILFSSGVVCLYYLRKMKKGKWMNCPGKR